MARVHVLDSSGSNTRLVFHIAIPSTGNNSIGVQWRTAVKFGVGPFPRASSMVVGTDPGQITSAENVQISNGEVVEYVETVYVPEGMNTAAANAFLDLLHADRTTTLLANLQKDLRYFSFTRS